MLRYTKNGPLRAPVCTSAWGASHPALQWLHCSNTCLKTETEKASFYGFHGEIKASGKHAGRASWRFLNRPVFCCFSSHLSTSFMLRAVKAPTKMWMLLGPKSGGERVPSLLPLMLSWAQGWWIHRWLHAGVRGKCSELVTEVAGVNPGSG